MKIDRLLDMEKYIAHKENVTMEELCARFEVSMNTVRRDVSELLKKGSFEKVYGGVRARKSPEQSLTPFAERRINNESGKRLICARAAEMVSDGDIIFIDSGTTVLALIERLSARRDITIITHNLEAIQRALPFDNLNVIALPGQLRRKTSSFTGLETVRSLRSYNIKTAFLASTGATTHGVTNSSPLEYEIKRCAVEISERSVLMLCAAKFGYAGLMTYASFGDFDAIVTDAPIGSPYLEAVHASGAELITAQDR